jgi:hypothetical protein
MNRSLCEPKFCLEILKKKKKILLDGIRTQDRPTRSIVITAITSHILN